MKSELIGGIDEAGRGPLAGPVSLALMVAPKGFRFQHPTLGRIKDSKQLSAKRREEWYKYLVSHKRLFYIHTYVSPRVIDRINIYQAVQKGAARLIRRCPTPPGFVYLDGSLILPSNIPHRVVIKGDERIPIVAAASIIAKVRRDRLMARLAKKYPGYNFEGHKGYGTRLHVAALRKIGSSPIHRVSFLSSILGRGGALLASLTKKHIFTTITG